MRLKAGKNLTSTGKRKGRPPKYLSEQKLANPLPAAKRELNKGGPDQVVLSHRNTIFISRLVQARYRRPGASQKQLAYELLDAGPALHKTEQDLAAVEARIRRVTGEGVNRVPVKKQAKRIVSPKAQR